MAVNIMDMPDEELANMTDEQLDDLIAKQESEAKTSDEQGEEGDDRQEPEQEPEEDDQPEETEQPAKESEGEPGEGSETPDASAEGGEKEPDQGEPEPKAEGKAAPEAPKERDYKAELERVLAPFKANGRNIQVESVDDVIALMQKGANYHKKMEGIKPRLAQLKILDREGLLEGDKLNFLIDLAKGDRGAINRLIKEHSVDTLELDGEKASQYKSNNYSVDESVVELDNVLDDLRESTHYTELLDTVGNKWDNASQKEISSKPDILRVIAAHMESGIFEKVQSQVDTERVLGRLNGLSSLEAYRTVGDRMHQAGKFNGVANTTTPPTKVAAVKPATKSAPVEDESKKAKKLAASPSGKKTVATGKQDYDPLNMSDEDFLKLDGKF